MAETKHLMTVNEMGQDLYHVKLYNYSQNGRKKIYSKITHSIPRLSDVIAEHYGTMVV